MDSKVGNIGSRRGRGQRTYYERWMEKEGVPVVEGFGVTDVRQSCSSSPGNGWAARARICSFAAWKGSPAFMSASSRPAHRRSPSAIFTRKSSTFCKAKAWRKSSSATACRRRFQWQTGSLFSPPMNALHRLMNHGSEPALFLAVTTAPMALDHYHNEHFIFNSDFSFNDRYDGEAGYFEPGNERYLASNNRQWIWETNFIPDARKAHIDAQEQKGAGVNITQFEIVQ